MNRIGGFRHLVEDALRGSRTYARQQMQHPETRDAVARVFDQAQQRQHVLDMGGVEEFQAAEFHERDVAAGQFDFQRTAMR
jgi:hypothetical protein